MASPSDDVSPPDSPASDASGTMPSPGRVDGSPAIARRRSEDGPDAGDDDEDEDPEEEGEETAPRDDDDDEDDEEDDDEEEITGHRRKRRRERRNQFLDVEAEVDEDEDENEDDEDELNELKDNFIADTHPDDLADLPVGGETDDRRHRELDRRREMEASLDAEKQAEILRQRYAKNRSGRAPGDSAVVPKRLLLPSVDDPSIWAVRCKEGKEREAVFAIMKRIEERIGTKEELAITSAFERGGTQSTMKGFIYVEAQRQADIMVALTDLMNVYPRTKMMLVEIKEMPDLLRVTKTPALEPGAYVRLKRPPKYAGDLAQVIDVTDTGLELRVRFVPRLDYGLHEDVNAPADAFGAKRKRPVAGPRPPQRLFSEVEARKRHSKLLGGGTAGAKSWNYAGDEYVNGYCEKEVKLQTLTVKDVNPTLEEVTRFASGAEDGTENLDLNALAASLKASTANASYLPGDIIEVYEGEQKGVMGKAISVQADIVTMAVSEGDLKGQTIEVPVKGLRKRFRSGDHVKVIGGSRFRDEVGMVVKISEDRVTLLSDHGNTEITVFSKDLREASDSGGSGSLGKFELWDLVQLDPSTVACIVKVDRESLVVLDQNNQTRTVMPSQISNKLEKRRHAVATDRNGNEIRLDETVKENGGEARSGKIIHIHRAYLFLRNPSQNENAGVFVTRTTAVSSVAAKGAVTASTGPDLTSMNPAMKRNPATGGDMPPPKTFGRDRSIGQTVTIRKGPYKGLLGIVKEATDSNARVELHTKNKTVNVSKDDLAFKDKLTGQEFNPNSRGGFGGGRGGATPRGRGGLGSATPGGWDGGRTPGAGGGVERTPAWGARTPAVANGGRTPAWKSSGDNAGGRTPGWADGSRTVNPYDGSRTSYGGGNRTPAWSSGAKTPAYGMSDGFAAGSKTPGYGGGGNDTWGSKTPAYHQPTSNDNWGSNQPQSNNGWGAGSYDAPTPGVSMSAPTPAAMNAPTPGAYSAPTPAPYNAPTPAAAPTPAPGWGGGGGGGWGAPTPLAMDAPTPGAQQGYYAAPTPGAYGAMPETPAANWQDDNQPRYTDN
ncbi:Transcription elongation factor SPT5 [Lachnellula arida]|uniref:Transcription elongation factor SPT5 n=1 Tax=Lachnellula arida TaxID=1316785 RepID=A0A8T9BP34_9HELO|nr:Transcription elongation factor SPT5 [Lachnellula arida]